MREIKFRAWHNGKAYYFTLQQIADWPPSYEWPSFNEFSDWEQFTGQRDKNGKEIYEGDILRHNENIFKIVFDERQQFCAENKNRSKSGLINWREYGWILRTRKYIEVIGNIHENPELLEATQ